MDYFTNRNGLELACRFSIKNQDDKKISIVCQLSLTEIFILSEFLFENLNCNTFGFNFTGNGNSQGEHTYAGFERDAGDIDDAIKYLSSLGYKVEAIIGHSRNAINVIVYSALYGQVNKIIALAPRFHMNPLPKFLQDDLEIIHQNKEIVHSAFGRGWKCTWDMIQELINTDMPYYCKRAKGDIYILHGDADEINPYWDSLEYVSELKEKCKGHFTLNCDHFFIGVFDEVIEIVF
ncbi:unnamed protein product [Blepharisma stoltei]|uniref:Uncharacterized protein n=1 Tax=Blepharisma stoltei TaxID=1481888 RepID=A0AAU9JV66_9CILI|nr:unnamed protein product [Blepharisma stoltei]